MSLFMKWGKSSMNTDNHAVNIFLDSIFIAC